MADDIPRWLRISGAILKNLFLLLTIIAGIVGLPWTKNKIENTERKVDSTLALLSSIQNQLQFQQQAQKQIQGQNQGQLQTQTSLQQANPNITIFPDTSQSAKNKDIPVVIDSLIPCNSWTPIPTSHDAEFRIECFPNNYDTVKAKVRFRSYEYSIVLPKKQEAMFIDSFSFYRRFIYIEFKDFSWSDLPRIRVKYIDYAILEKKRPGHNQ